MKHILKYIKPYILIITLTLILKFVAAMMDLLIPSFLEKILDDVVPIAKETGVMRDIFLYGGAMIGFALVSISMNTLANYTAAKTSGKITQKIRHDVFEKISYFSSPQLDRVTVPSAVSRLTSDTYNINQFLARMQRIGVRAPILLIGGLVITFTMDAKFTLVLVATLPLIALLVYLVTKKSVPLYTKQQSTLDRMVRVLRENITGVRVIRALAKEDHEKKRYEEVNSDLADVEYKAGSVTALTSPVSSLILNLALTAIIVVGAFRVNKGEAQIGKIIAFQSYFTIILNAMLGITRVFVMMSKAEASSARVGEILESDTDEKLEEALDVQDERSKQYHIEFRDVCFSYNKNENNLANISFALERGQTLGIIGSTGSGKSTIINLLMRFYRADSGKVLIDGKNVNSIPQSSLHERFGAVFQNDFLMSGSIKDNIGYFRDIDEAKIEKAAEFAQASDFIKAKGGLDYELAVGANNISGGQKQRLLIARALASDPEILILDDSSSALDYMTDASLRKALSEHFAATTKIIIAQRVSSIRHADKILVLDDGKAVGYGTHEELMLTCDAYRETANEQMGAKATGGERVG